MRLEREAGPDLAGICRPWKKFDAVLDPMRIHWTLYLFPVAAVTNDQKLCGLKQHRFILSQFWSPEVPNPFHQV